MNKEKLEFFTENFFQIASQLYDDYIQSNGNITDEQLINKIRYQRDQLIREYGIDPNSKDTETKLIELINDDHDAFLKDNGIDNAQHFVQSFILGKAQLKSDEQQQFIQCVCDYEQSQDLGSLYYFGHILEPMDVNQFTQSFHSITRGLGMSQKAEILGSMAVFLENFAYEEEGASFIQQAQDHREVPEQWFEQLIEKMYERSPMGLAIAFDYHDQSIKMKTQGSGLFDAQYLIKRADNDVGSIQISATSSLASSFEGDSPVRHALSNAVTSYLLNQYVERLAQNEKDKERDRLYNDTISKGYNGNEIYDENNPEFIDSNIEQHLERIHQRFKSDFIDGYFHNLHYVKKTNNNGNEIDSLTFHNDTLEQLMLQAINYGSKSDFETFEQAIRAINEDPTVYIQSIFNIEEGESVQQHHIDKLMGDNPDNPDWYVFKPSAYFSSFHPTVSIKDKYKNAPIVQNVFEAGEMSPEAFRIQSQFLGNLHYCTSNLHTQCSFGNGVWDSVLKNKINSRGQSNNNKISNSQNSELDIQRFEAIIFEQFFIQTPKNIQLNQLALDKGGARKNINDYIESFIINIETEEQFKEKMANSNIETSLSYEEVLDNMKEALFVNHGLQSRIKSRHSNLEKDKISLINQGLTIKTYEPEHFQQFIKDNELSQKMQQTIDNFYNMNYNGGTRRVDIETLNLNKEFEIPNTNLNQTKEEPSAKNLPAQYP